MATEENNNQFSNYSVEKLQSLYEELGRSATEAGRQMAVFFGKGMQAGADIYEQAASDFTSLQEKVKEELDARKEQQQQQQQQGQQEQQKESLQNNDSHSGLPEDREGTGGSGQQEQQQQQEQPQTEQQSF